MSSISHSDSLVTLISGLPGVGKTHWVLQRCLQFNQPIGFASLGAETLPIDARMILTKCPQVRYLEELEHGLNILHGQGVPIYLEIGFYIDLTSLDWICQGFPCHRVAIASPGLPTSEGLDWADEIVEGIAVAENSSQLWRSPLTGQVLEAASLNTFWDELINGAYGTVERAKGIFEVQDGRAFHFSFVSSQAETDYEELNLPRWLAGRPTRFSGIEVVGAGFNEAAIAETLRDCCLDDTAIAYTTRRN
jgi:hypothetical protein